MAADRAAEADRHAARARAWREADPDRARASVRTCYRNNIEKRREYNRARSKTPEGRVYAKKVYRKHAAKRIAAVKAYRLERLEKFRAYYKDYVASNPDKYRAYAAQRRARKREVGGSHTADDIKDIRKAQGDKCAVCRTSLRGRGSVDHIVALVNGGSNNRSNLQLLCKSCNSSKRSRDPVEFMQSRGFLL